MELFQVPHSRIGSWPHPQTLDKAGKACQKQTLQLITKSLNYGSKIFYSTGPSLYPTRCGLSDQGVTVNALANTKTLTYRNAIIITTVKSFIVQVPGVDSRLPDFPFDSTNPLASTINLFYGRNLFRTLLGQSVCHCLSLQHCLIFSRQILEPTL